MEKISAKCLKIDQLIHSTFSFLKKLCKTGTAKLEEPSHRDNHTQLTHPSAARTKPCTGSEKDKICDQNLDFGLLVIDSYYNKITFSQSYYKKSYLNI